MIDLKRPEWIDVSLTTIPQAWGIDDYIDLLEKKVIEISKELDKYKEKERLTELWARGELLN